MANILLIGTLHYGLLDAQRLKKALEIEKPGILTVEASSEWLDNLAKNWDQDVELCLQAIRDNHFSQQVYSFIEGYLKSLSNSEIDVCRNYANQNGIRLYLIDDPTMAGIVRQEMLSQLKILLNNTDPKVLDRISLESVIKGQDAMYTDIQSLYDGQIPAIDGEKQFIDSQRGKFIGKRDETEATNLTELAKDHNARIVHVGGVMHNLTDSKGETLYSKLETLNPSRTTLLSYK